MFKIIRSTVTIFLEFAALFFSVLWYLNNRDFEPFISMIISLIAFFSSISSRLFQRPKLVLHKKTSHWGRRPTGYTRKTPKIIQVGIDKINQYWELDWNYELEIRNNASLSAYNIEIKYDCLPTNIKVRGQIGKIEPLLPTQ